MNIELYNPGQEIKPSKKIKQPSRLIYGLKTRDRYISEYAEYIDVRLVKERDFAQRYKTQQSAKKAKDTIEKMLQVELEVVVMGVRDE